MCKSIWKVPESYPFCGLLTGTEAISSIYFYLNTPSSFKLSDRDPKMNVNCQLVHILRATIGLSLSSQAYEWEPMAATATYPLRRADLDDVMSFLISASLNGTTLLRLLLKLYTYNHSFFESWFSAIVCTSLYFSYHRSNSDSNKVISRAAFSPIKPWNPKCIYSSTSSIN